MESQFQYRFRKTSWGIFIDLTAEFIPFDTASGESTFNGLLPVTEKIWLQLHPGFPRLTEDEYKIVLESSDAVPPGIIKISELLFPLTDYQPEGLVCALRGWAAREWDIPRPDIPIRYDKSNDVYFFQLPGLPKMGTHALKGCIILEETAT